MDEWRVISSLGHESLLFFFDGCWQTATEVPSSIMWFRGDPDFMRMPV
jgi:hypothetical protein